MAEHIEERPTWDCRVCGDPWPCNPARERLAAELSPTALRINMWTRMEVAIGDLPPEPAGELFDRFLRWTG
ncbi:hypothetical protein [Krasilnikovia sp. MM14-A1259]|uniref:hypothetical protein n=1 Tax=Krasilnikovia sp. MM14-A1259 TaxID=3373539 RepID=UPI0037FDE217